MTTSTPPKPRGHRKDYSGSTCVIRRAETPKRCTHEVAYDQECGRLIPAGALYAEWTAMPWHDAVDTDGHFWHMPTCDLHPEHWGL